MQTQSHSATAQILPTSINWSCYCGIQYHYDRIPLESLVSAGLVTADEIPIGRRSGSSRGDDMRWHKCKNGTVNVRFDADFLMSRDTAFKCFLGSLLADTRLSLVKGESHV